MFHSAEWDHSHDLAGERVAVIGTGASAAQFIPHVGERAAQMDVFQRTPPWVLPKPDFAHGPRTHRAFRRFPACSGRCATASTTSPSRWSTA